MSVRSDRDAFVAQRQERWVRLDHALGEPRHDAAGWAQLAADYRAVCADLARARALGVPADVLEFLDGLAGRAHNTLYGSRRAGGLRLLHDVAVGFPRELRAQSGFFWLATALFYGPFLVGVLGSLADPGFAAAVLSPAQLAELEQGYGSGDMTRGFGSDATMAGFYVMNNVGIAFRCFATGVLGGLGSLFYLVYNGVVIGTVAGYLASVGLGGNLLEFICGHGPWELTGVCVSGAAGLRLGWALVVTEGRTIAGSLRAAGPSLYRLVLGTTVLLLVAAAVEGFWSAGPAPRWAKHAFAVLQVGIVASWLWFGGRGAR